MFEMKQLYMLLWNWAEKRLVLVEFHLSDYSFKTETWSPPLTGGACIEVLPCLIQPEGNEHSFSYGTIEPTYGDWKNLWK